MKSGRGQFLFFSMIIGFPVRHTGREDWHVDWLRVSSLCQHMKIIVCERNFGALEH